jgi:Uroporphyrinogen decarboxylase (URO-D)
VICTKPREVTQRDIERLLAEPLVIDESQFELVRYVVEKLGRKHFIIVRGWHSPTSWLDGTFPVPGEGLNMHMDAFGVRLPDEPQFIPTLFDVYTRRALGLAFAISRVYPATDEAALRCVSSSGVFVLKHTDGNGLRLLPMMIEAGMDALHGIQPSCGMEVKKIEEKFGDRITVIGAVECDTLVQGRAEQIAREVEDCIRDGAPGRGFVLASSNSIQAGAKFENYMAMPETARKRGRFPIATA